MRVPRSESLHWEVPLTMGGEVAAKQMALKIHEEVKDSETVVLSSHALGAIQTAYKIISGSKYHVEFPLEAYSFLGPAVRREHQKMLEDIKSRIEKYECAVIITHAPHILVLQGGLWNMFKGNAKYPREQPSQLNNGEACSINLESGVISFIFP